MNTIQGEKLAALRLLSVGVLILVPIVVFICLSYLDRPVLVFAAIAAGLLSVAALFLSRSGEHGTAARIQLRGIALVSLIIWPLDPEPLALVFQGVLVLGLAWLDDLGRALRLGYFQSLCFMGVAPGVLYLTGRLTPVSLQLTVVGGAMVLLFTLLVDRVFRESGWLQAQLSAKLVELERVLSLKTRVQAGDLRAEAQRDGIGEALEVVLTAVREPVVAMRNSGQLVGAAAQRLGLELARQEADAEQAAQGLADATDQVRSIDELAREISRSAAEVTSQAEESKRAGRITDERLQRLARAAVTTGGLVDDLRDLARSVEIVALNAAIESARLGQGDHDPVAEQLGRLTERVIETLRVVEGHTVEIQRSAEASLEASERSHTASAEVAELARSIQALVDRQTAGTSNTAELVRGAASLARRNVEGSRQALEATGTLGKLAGKLVKQADQFSLDKPPLEPPR